MAIHKIKSGRVSSLTADQYIGQAGTIFYNESVGDLRLSDGKTLGGIPLSSGSLGGTISVDYTARNVDGSIIAQGSGYTNS